MSFFFKKRTPAFLLFFDKKRRPRCTASRMTSSNVQAVRVDLTKSNRFFAPALWTQMDERLYFVKKRRITESSAFFLTKKDVRTRLCRSGVLCRAGALDKVEPLCFDVVVRSAVADNFVESGAVRLCRVQSGSIYSR